jgi:hypothetical protein
VLTDDRLTLDEASFDFRGLDPETLERHLDQLNNVLDGLRRRGLTVRVHPWLWDSLECLDGCLICDFIYQPRQSSVSPDTLRLLGIQLDRCTAWDEGDRGFLHSLDPIELRPAGADAPAADRSVRLEPSFSVGIVLSPGTDRLMACLVFRGCPRRGFWSAADSAGGRQAYFFAEVEELPDFWRSLYAREQVAEPDFFSLADHAFPDLVLHPGLSFGRFDGRYRDLRDRVVAILGVLNDHFATAMTVHSGLPQQVKAALGQFGVDLSPESPNTHGSSRLMALREVSVDGRVYRCEWHAKLEPHRNRIHFSLPSPELAGRIVVGIFVDHLLT